MTPMLALLLLAPSAVARPQAVSPGAAESVLHIGDLAPRPGDDCITPEDRRRAREAIAEYETRFGPLSTPAGDGFPLYEFVPHAGNLFGDLIMGNFVDLDPNPGSVLTFECTQWAYDTHGGHDISIRSFAEQAVGVPVLSALDGTVIGTHDGEGDMNTSCVGIANSVIIDHGDGRIAYYWHLKRDSVAVSPGQNVVAGQQIGLTGSSGCSTWPHLHFETRDSSVVYEPFAGACRPGPSGWVNQPQLVTETYLNDFGVTATNIASVPPPPAPWPRHAQMAFTDPTVYLWMLGGNLPATGTIRTRFFRPNGTPDYDSGNLAFNNGRALQFWYIWLGLNVANMRTIAGTWRVIVDIDGEQMIDAPIVVVPQREPNFNRPPEPIAAEFDPPAPASDNVIFCRVNSSLVLDDLDWDVVRYTYEWTIDGVPYRSITSAGMADAIPRGAAPPGSQLACTVTPGDGKALGTPVQIAVTVGGSGCEPCDLNCDGAVDAFDIEPFVALLTGGGQACSPCAGDANGDGAVDAFDIEPFITCLVGP